MRHSLLLFSLMTCSSIGGAANGPVPNEDEFLLNTLWDEVRILPAKGTPAVGLALGGGGARGLAHIGVLKVLEEEGIPVHQLAGASVGALIGALYAAGASTTKLETMANDIGWDDITNHYRIARLRTLQTQTLLT